MDLQATYTGSRRSGRVVQHPPWHPPWYYAGWPNKPHQCRQDITVKCAGNLIRVKQSWTYSPTK